MLNLPVGHDLDLVEKRATKIIATAKSAGNCPLLRELWCLLRNAEMTMPLGTHRDGVHRIRDGVARDIIALECLN
ncbi:hypothetical protein [Lysobacter panacisoli]|uniref:hypothetical protein n=1 Tax=Lysobacter panacisoli TaxID=1255263 RepID=UPI00131BDB5F|nr:hypothetical protein [Lysobacter panacisoli]